MTHWARCLLSLVGDNSTTAQDGCRAEVDLSETFDDGVYGSFAKILSLRVASLE